VIRECIEEIGIDLQQNSLYLGKIFKNFFAYPYKEGHMFISVHIFLVV
jgi:hypothetical protein